MTTIQDQTNHTSSAKSSYVMIVYQTGEQRDKRQQTAKLVQICMTSLQPCTVFHCRALTGADKRVFCGSRRTDIDLKYATHVSVEPSKQQSFLNI